MSIDIIEDFIKRKTDWITKHQEKIQKRNSRKELKSYSEKEIFEMKKQLQEYIIPRVHMLWEWKNLPPITHIKITKSEWRWGSCSVKNWLCFSYRLTEYLLQNEMFIDAIIIHELAHFREKNHQKPFWNLVYSWMPEYEEIIKNQRDWVIV
jgi:predicted metal-dependent hydrolase